MSKKSSRKKLINKKELKKIKVVENEKRKKCKNRKKFEEKDIVGKVGNLREKRERRLVKITSKSK